MYGIDVKQLYFDFKGVDSTIQHSVDIWAENRQTQLDRANKNIRRFNSGEEKMTLVDLKSRKHRDYLVSFTMTKYAEADASKECVDYPTENFDTYNDCDRAFILQVFRKIS